MTKLFDIKQQAVEDIRSGLNDLSDWLLQIQRTVGASDSKLSVDAEGRLIIAGDKDTIIHGSLGVGVDTVPNDVAIETSLPVRFQGKKFEVNSEVPKTGLYNKGDMVWNDNPVPNGTLGWICIRTGTPGEWRTFGMIGG
jgi:hypothetical protein